MYLLADLIGSIGIEAPSLYAAFGSKRDLFREALAFYVEHFQGFVRDGFYAAPTARGAIEAYLSDPAIGLTSANPNIPRGCIVTLATAGSGDHGELGEYIRSVRKGAFDRLEARIAAAVRAGELPKMLDVPSVARFVQSGMCLLARDGASRTELSRVANAAIDGW